MIDGSYAIERGMRVGYIMSLKAKRIAVCCRPSVIYFLCGDLCSEKTTCAGIEQALECNVRIEGNAV